MGSDKPNTAVHLKSVMPVLRVTNLDTTIRFYESRLGFAVAWRAPNDGGGENCMLEAGDVAVMVSTGSHLGATPAFTGTLYFDASDVAQLFAAVKDSVPIAWPLSETEYGTLEFGLRDPDGYTLAFAEER